MDKVIISGNSMANTYKNGDAIWIEKISYRSNISRFDTVVIHTKSSGNIIKRAIGLPTETVLIKDGHVYINGKILNEESNIYIQDGGNALQGVKLSTDQYFVLGDNRNDSMDSRFNSIGTIKKEDIIGKPFFRFYPFDKIGKVN
jgi:signal peptidase I